MSSGDYLSLVYLEGSFRKALSNTFGALAPGASYLQFCLKMPCWLDAVLWGSPASWCSSFCVGWLNFNKICYLQPMCLLRQINSTQGCSFILLNKVICENAI